ncbi:MAG: hypothetical protein M1833_003862 [Piccolia ochrophora]|nr:MAG: hypothetical protein M1833_003862 [Piccolia ochrophora]
MLIVSDVLWILGIPGTYTNVEVSTGLRAPPLDFIQQANRYLKIQFATMVLFWSLIWSVKISFMVFFYRLRDHLKRQNIIWWCIFGFVVVAYLTSVVTYPIAWIGTCAPFDILRPCVTRLILRRATISLRFTTAMDIITNTLFMAIPFRLLWKVQLPRAQKLRLGLVFSLGVIIISSDIMRIIFTNPIAPASPEVTWLALWTSLESEIGKPTFLIKETSGDVSYTAIITVCLASFRTIFASPTRPSDGSYFSGSSYSIATKVNEKFKSRKWTFWSGSNTSDNPKPNNNDTEVYTDLKRAPDTSTMRRVTRIFGKAYKDRDGGKRPADGGAIRYARSLV